MASSNLHGVPVERWQRSLRRTPLCLCLLGEVFFVLGCGHQSKRAAYLQDVEDRTNTFRMCVTSSLGFGAREWVKEIRVFELQSDATGNNARRLCWEIMGYAVADGFEIVPGQVPKRFTQIYPAVGEVFKPIPGRTYEISVVTDLPSGEPLGMKTLWVAR